MSSITFMFDTDDDDVLAPMTDEQRDVLWLYMWAREELDRPGPASRPRARVPETPLS